MNLDRATDFEASVMRRAFESGDRDLLKAVTILVNQAISLRYQNATLHLGVNPYSDPATTSLNRLARHTRKIAKPLRALINLVPDQHPFTTPCLQRLIALNKAEWAFEQMNLPPIMKVEGQDLQVPQPILLEEVSKSS